MPTSQSEKAKAEAAAKADWGLAERERLELVIGVPSIPVETSMLFVEEPVAQSFEPHEDGRHLVREEPDGTEVYAHVEDGRIIKYSAERGGSEVEFIHPDVAGHEHHEYAQILWRCFRTQDHWACYRHHI
jgi:hypothetical protein